MRRREGNRTDRRIAPEGSIPEVLLAVAANTLRYIGSGHHKLQPGDYGFVPSHNPRPSKSVCDDRRPILKEEAVVLFWRGIELGMVSAFGVGGFPKYVWAVDEFEEVWEAKIGTPPDYHGYRLGDDDRVMRRHVLAEWRLRCRKD